MPKTKRPIDQNQIDKMPAGPELDALIAEHIFGRKGFGYYGPPLEGSWSHEKSIRYDTKEEAIEAYRVYSRAKYGDDRPR